MHGTSEAAAGSTSEGCLMVLWGMLHAHALIEVYLMIYKSAVQAAAFNCKIGISAEPTIPPCIGDDS